MSAIRDEIIEWAFHRDQRAKARQERTKNRVHCPVCGARIGQCKMPHPTYIVDSSAKPDEQSVISSCDVTLGGPRTTL